jgi:ubiquinone/menaquinone biosynthesis C-methylase UbiE/glutathione S-transferase
MDTGARLRLYQYAYSPFCIPIALILKHSGITHEVIDLPPGDPSTVIKLTKAEYYQVPILEDLFSHEIIFDKSPSGDDVPKYIESIVPTMRLFPQEVDGINRIFIHYIENECESWGFKACDVYRDNWMKTDLERGLHRRHKERKFGVGCLEAWARDIKQIIEGFHKCMQPFEQVLANRPFLTGERPVYADYALCGVIGNFLFPGNTSLPENCLMLEAWYTKMRAGNFRTELDDMKIAEGEGGGDSKSHIFADVTDVEKAIADIKLRPGTYALDVGTGDGHTAIYLAEKGLYVTACDTSPAVLEKAAALAKEKKVSINFQQHGSDNLPYADNALGLIISRMEARRFPAHETFVREAARTLKTYGYLVLIDYTVPDDHIEANHWMNQLEKLRDPSHVRFVPPNQWKLWCQHYGLTVTKSVIETVKMHDLNWYFNMVNTPPENRKKALEMLGKAPTPVRELFKIGQEDGKIVWNWRRMTFVAGKI